MFRKRFFIKFDIQLDAITCPGVWLCKHGYLEATIKTLGYILRTGAMEPRFPLLAHDKFSIEGYFKSSLGSMGELVRVLAAENLEITLWQNGRRLAYFIGKLDDILSTGVQECSMQHSFNVELLMKATSAFPGILAPKVELTANVGVRDRLDNKRRSRSNRSNNSNEASLVHRSASYSGEFVIPKFVSKTAAMRKNRHKKSNCCNYLDSPRRQLPVCHTRHFSSESNSNSSNSSSLFRCTPLSNINGLTTFKANSVSHNKERRRLSDSSGQSSYLTSSYSTESTDESSVNCIHGLSIEALRVEGVKDDHQDFCEICQSYRNVFMREKRK